MVKSQHSSRSSRRRDEVHDPVIQSSGAMRSMKARRIKRVRVHDGDGVVPIEEAAS